MNATIENIRLKMVRFRQDHRQQIAKVAHAVGAVATSVAIGALAGKFL
jgi:hypothetical protein